ncbi:MAG: ankyrin repeat domain-containing protein [Planctomycetaceae bacterium]
MSRHFKGICRLLGIVVLALGLSSCDHDVSRVFVDANEASLIRAVKSNDVAQIQALISAGVNVNAVGTDESTPLFVAIDSTNFEAFEVLLKNGADPNQATKTGMTAVFRAAEVRKASRWLQATLDHGGNPNQTKPIEMNCGRVTPLFYAIRARSILNVEVLINNGRKPFVCVNSCGATPLNGAAKLSML